MRLLFIPFILILIFSGCDDKKMSSQYLTNVTAVRETEESSNTPKTAAPPVSVASGRETAVTPPMPEQSSSQYHIIVRSYDISRHKEAQEMVRKLKEQGYPAMSINRDKRFRVSIEHFNNKAEADKACEEYRKATENNDIWVLYLK